MEVKKGQEPKKLKGRDKFFWGRVILFCDLSLLFCYIRFFCDEVDDDDDVGDADGG